MNDKKCNQLLIFIIVIILIVLLISNVGISYKGFDASTEDCFVHQDSNKCKLVVRGDCNKTDWYLRDNEIDEPEVKKYCFAKWDCPYEAYEASCDIKYNKNGLIIYWR